MGKWSAHASIGAISLLGIFVSLPVAADMYKWVDERGVVTYSNAPPIAGSRVRKVEGVAERISVYTPDEKLNRTMRESSERDSRIASLERQLERQLERERQAGSETRKRTSTGVSAAFERCVAERRVDCETMRTAGNDFHARDGYGSPLIYAPAVYAPAYVIGTARRAVQPVIQPFQVIDETPRIGVDNRPRVGINNSPPVGAPRRVPTVGAFR